MNDEVKEVIEIIENLEVRVNSYWNFYVVVVLATIGWLMSSRIPFTMNQGIALIISVSLFFLANFSVLKSSTKRIIAFESELNTIANGFKFKSTMLRKELSKPAIRYRLASSYLLHIIIDVAVIYAIWSKLA